jgi:Gpi18-like mannosyltransferase
MDLTCILILLLIAAGAVLLLRAEELAIGTGPLLLSIVLTGTAFLIRIYCLPHETLDYQDFLSVWVEYFKENGGWAALSQNVGNYNVPYLYFLALFSYSDINPLYLIKILSIFFDVLLAYGVLKLSSLFTQNRTTRFAAFFLTLFLPTVVLNGAYWGQCDSIYVAFAVWGIYFALCDRPVFSMVAIALSFAFKLQAVFIMPLWLIFLYTRKIRWYHLGIFPLTYLVVVLPAVLTGRPLWDTLTLYINQGGTVGSGLNYNSSSVFAFATQNTDVELFSRLGIIAAFVAMGMLLFLLYLRRDRLDNAGILCAGVFLSVVIPFLLPHMHDRYFYMADILTLAYAVIFPQMFLLPLCCQFASLLGYHAYLKLQYLYPMYYGSCALILVLALLIVELVVLTGHSSRHRSPPRCT